MAIVYLEDPITGKKVLAESSVGVGGGWRVTISSYNFIYSRLKENPKAFVGMVFRDVSKETVRDGMPCFIKITQAAPRWVKASKPTELPYLEYQAVKWAPIEDQLSVIEAIEAHRVKIEGEFKEKENGTDEGN